MGKNNSPKPTFWLGRRFLDKHWKIQRPIWLTMGGRMDEQIKPTLIYRGVYDPNGDPDKIDIELSFHFGSELGELDIRFKGKRQHTKFPMVHVYHRDEDMGLSKNGKVTFDGSELNGVLPDGRVSVKYNIRSRGQRAVLSVFVNDEDVIAIDLDLVEIRQ